MAQATYTPNLRLKITSDLSLDAKYNLGVIDYLGGKVYAATNGDTKLRSSTSIVIEPDSPEVAGGTGQGTGDLGLGTPSNYINNLNIYATNITYNGAIISGFQLGRYCLFVGDSSNIAQQLDTSLLGDVLVSVENGLKLKDGVVGEQQVSSLPISKIELLQEALDEKANLVYVDAELALRDSDISAVQSNLSAHEASQTSHAATAITLENYRNMPGTNVQEGLEFLYELFDATIAYQVDGGEPDSIYGGTTPVDGGEI